MATPAQTLNCPEQKLADSIEQQGPVGVGSLKNGSMMEDMPSDDISGAMNNNIQSPNSNINTKARSVKMENFQDGGTHQLNIRPTATSGAEQIGYPGGMERQRLSQDFPGYGQNNRESINEEYHNSQEGYNHIVGNSSYPGSTERTYLQEHGGHSLGGNNTELNANSQQNKLYSQYNQNQMRPIYSQSPRPMNLGTQARHGPSSNMPMMANYPNNSQQRILSGQSISQQGGPTPTLNQLLQSPNTAPRYHNSYNEYSGPPSQYPGSSASNSGPHGWGNIRTSNAYSQSLPSSMFRNQQQQQAGSSGPSELSKRAPPAQGYPPPGQESPPTPQQQQQTQYPAPPRPQGYPPRPQADGGEPSSEPSAATPPPSGLRAASSPLRPSPSPSPASSSAPGTPGPQPPRPPSSSQQPESGGGPPMASAATAANTPQGYGQQQMAPPPGMYPGAKIHPMSPYSPQPRSAAPMHHPQANTGGPNYMGMQQNYAMSSQNSYPGYRQNFTGSSGGYGMGGYGGGGGYGMMPPPSQYGKVQSAVQPSQQPSQPPSQQTANPAARQSPMYLRQHLQQKMYSGGGGDSPYPGSGCDSNPEFPATPPPPPPAALDEGSQASTSSSLPEEHEGSKGKHPPTPNTLPSPGAASMSSFHDEFDSVSSPSWPRTPASPRPDGLLKLYDMSEDPDRRVFLDKLIMFNEERGNPISQCPTISKQPLDLYKLYLIVKDRGGFIEVTRAKHWKDVAGALGIGASSSAAYTLRKQYIKHLLPYECKYDRGGIDPAPIINQVEATMKKKGSKTQNCHDPFGPPPMMDGAGYPGSGYPGGPYPGMMPNTGYSPGGQPYPTGGEPMHMPNHMEESFPGEEIAAHYPPRPDHQAPYPTPAYGGQQGYQASTANTEYPATASGGTEPPPTPATNNAASSPAVVPPSPYPRGEYSGSAEYPPTNRTVNSTPPTAPYPPYPSPAAAPGIKQERYEAPTGGDYPPRYPTPTPEAPFSTRAGQYPPPQPGYEPGYRGPAPDQQPPYQNNHVPRLQQSSLAQRLMAKVNQSSSHHGYSPGAAAQYSQGAAKTRDMYPPRGEMYPKYPPGKEPPYYGGPYPTAADRGQYPGGPYRQQGWPPGSRQYPPQGQYMWEGGPRHPSPAEPPAWQQQASAYPPESPYGKMAATGPPYGRPAYGPPPPPSAAKMPPSVAPPTPSSVVAVATRKEFPPHTVEAVTPVLTKRRRLTARDVSPLEAWRLLMALKSGLLAESTWALDVLAVLLHDDTTVLYFGLSHLPGLLEALMEHFRRCLLHMFRLTEDLDIGYNFAQDPPPSCRRRKWYRAPATDRPSREPSGNSPLVIDPGDKTLLLADCDNFTAISRCGKPVRTRVDQSLFIFDPDKKWDSFEGFNSGTDHWQMGGGDITIHIQTHFEPIDSSLKFVRVMEEKESDYSTDEEEEEDKLFSKPLKESSSKAVSIIPVINCIKNSLVVGEENSSKSSDVNENCDEKKEEEEVTYPRLRPPTIKRKQLEDVEEECYNRDEPSLYLISDAQNSLASRCICISNILRNLSFVPGNDAEMSKHPGFLLVLGRLLVLHHKHSLRRASQRHYGSSGEEGADADADSCSSLNGEDEWWWETLHGLRENCLVTLANVACQLDLAPYPEEISLPLLDGLLHWATCPSSYAQDPLPQCSLSPQRLALETLCKLSILDNNMDLLLATPPWPRTERLFAFLARSLGRHEDQVLREFSVVLLSNLARADSAAARAIALQPCAIPHLLLFVEQAEQSAYQVANAQGVNALRENPELMGTTLDMVRRAAGTLRCLARVPDNRPLFLQYQPRLLTLVMSQILDQGVAAIVADVLFECSSS